MANTQGRPLAFVLTPGNVADIGVAAHLFEGIAPPRRLLADKAYAAGHSRLKEQKSSSLPVPPDADPTRYDRRARNFLSAIAIHLA